MFTRRWEGVEGEPDLVPAAAASPTVQPAATRPAVQPSSQLAAIDRQMLGMADIVSSAKPGALSGVTINFNAIGTVENMNQGGRENNNNNNSNSSRKIEKKIDDLASALTEQMNRHFLSINKQLAAYRGEITQILQAVLAGNKQGKETHNAVGAICQDNELLLNRVQKGPASVARDLGPSFMQRELFDVKSSAPQDILLTNGLAVTFWKGLLYPKFEAFAKGEILSFVQQNGLRGMKEEMDIGTFVFPNLLIDPSPARYKEQVHMALTPGKDSFHNLVILTTENDQNKGSMTFVVASDILDEETSESWESIGATLAPALGFGASFNITIGVGNEGGDLHNKVVFTTAAEDPIACCAYLRPLLGAVIDKSQGIVGVTIDSHEHVPDQRGCPELSIPNRYLRQLVSIPHMEVEFHKWSLGRHAQDHLTLAKGRLVFNECQLGGNGFALFVQDCMNEGAFATPLSLTFSNQTSLVPLDHILTAVERGGRLGFLRLEGWAKSLGQLQQLKKLFELSIKQQRFTLELFVEGRGIDFGSGEKHDLGHQAMDEFLRGIKTPEYYNST